MHCQVYPKIAEKAVKDIEGEYERVTSYLCNRIENLQVGHVASCR